MFEEGVERSSALSVISLHVEEFSRERPYISVDEIPGTGHEAQASGDGLGVFLGKRFEADEILQELMSKRRVKFLQVTDAKVRQAIKERGECWRISPLPQSSEQMQQMILDARIAIGGRPIYYYNKFTGTRYLTCQEFARLGELEPVSLAQHLKEIAHYSAIKNRFNQHEVDFFLADATFGTEDFAKTDFLHANPSELAAAYQALKVKFLQAVPPELREDNVENPEWRNRMFSHLIGQKNETLSDEILKGLSPEYFLQIEWLPGGRIEEGELLFDIVFDEPGYAPGTPNSNDLCDPKVKGLIFNFIREFGDVDYVNVGRVTSSLSRRPKEEGRREVYIAELKQHDAESPVVRIIRMQKWGIREHLEESKDLLTAIMESEEYTEYVLDRRLGCRQLGMQIPARIGMWRISETYSGQRPEYRDARIWASYFERDYVHGFATDKITHAKYESPAFALAFARLLGKAAAPNIIVGRCRKDNRVLFDDGDEVLIEDAAGSPEAIMVTDHTGAFLDYQTPLESFAKEYAQPITGRLSFVTCPRDFIDAYVRA
ncbi:MAG: hypothetical protein M1608_08010, partial [Candidatus Omnitrophica bacterium]|nr:hypothetical protein [Candidatus Omnitrophota bacterium]